MTLCRDRNIDRDEIGIVRWRVQRQAQNPGHNIATSVNNNNLSGCILQRSIPPSLFTPPSVRLLSFLRFVFLICHCWKICTVSTSAELHLVLSHSTISMISFVPLKLGQLPWLSLDAKRGGWQKNCPSACHSLCVSVCVCAHARTSVWLCWIVFILLVLVPVILSDLCLKFRIVLFHVL